LHLGSASRDQALRAASAWRGDRQARHAQATNFKQCLATEVPAFVTFYRAADGFNGADEFVLEIAWAGGRKEV